MGAIDPTLGVDRVRDESRFELMLFCGEKNAGFAQQGRELVRSALGRRGDQPIKCAAMIDNEQFTGVADAEGGDLEFGAREFLVPGEPRSIMARAPDRAARVVTINVGPIEFGEALAVINDAAGERAGLGVMML